jgi:endonuclease III
MGFDTTHVAKEVSRADPSKLLVDVIISRISEDDVTEPNMERSEDYGS